MRKILISTTLIFFSLFIYSQSGQINGFKDFKFNSTLKSYPNFQFKENIDFGYYEKYLTCYKVLNLPANLKIGENKVNSIYLFCYNEQIIRIDVEFASLEYEGLVKMFGVPNKEQHWRSDNYSNGEERAAWDIPNSLIYYLCTWYTKQLTSSYGISTLNLATYRYKLSFKVRHYESILKAAQDKESKKSLNDFNSPI